MIKYVGIDVNTRDVSTLLEIQLLDAVDGKVHVYRRVSTLLEIQLGRYDLAQLLLDHDRFNPS